MAMTLSDLQACGLEIAAKYDELTHRPARRTWTRAETLMGFVGDVGDLAQLAMAADNVRSDFGTADETHDALAHELTGCLWAVLVLAACCEVDIEAAYVDMMDELDIRLSS